MPRNMVETLLGAAVLAVALGFLAWAYGNSSAGDFVAMRFGADGTPDAGFGQQGLVITPMAASAPIRRRRVTVVMASAEASPHTPAPNTTLTPIRALAGASQMCARPVSTNTSNSSGTSCALFRIVRMMTRP